MISVWFLAPSLDAAVRLVEEGLDWGSPDILEGLPWDISDLEALLGGPSASRPEDGAEVGEAYVVPVAPALVHRLAQLDTAAVESLGEAWEDESFDWFGMAEDGDEALRLLHDFARRAAESGRAVFLFLSP